MTARKLIRTMAAVPRLPGVLAVLAPGDPDEFEGDPKWRELLGHFLCFHRHTTEDSMRVTLMHNALVAEYINDRQIGIVLEKNHPTTKSLARILRKCERDARELDAPSLKPEVPPCES